ncbi:MAG TPA: S4 domain-containing protein, partial [Tepidiformaceae bacterium]|nr:S4 domain-containing protein [Tepidiformaceae bacterium]
MSALGNPSGDGRLELRELVAPAAGRVDAVVAAACPDLSRARVQRLIDAGHVRVAGMLVRKSVHVEQGAEIAVEVPETEHAPADVTFDLPILYEDEVL